MWLMTPSRLTNVELTTFRMRPLLSLGGMARRPLRRVALYSRWQVVPRDCWFGHARRKRATASAPNAMVIAMVRATAVTILHSRFDATAREPAGRSGGQLFGHSSRGGISLPASRRVDQRDGAGREGLRAAQRQRSAFDHIREH